MPRTPTDSGEPVYGTPDSDTASTVMTPGLTPGSTVSYGGVRKRQRIDDMGSSREMPVEAATMYPYSHGSGAPRSERGYSAQPGHGQPSGAYEREQEAQTNTTASTLLKREVYNSHDALQLLFEAVGASTPAPSGAHVDGGSDTDKRRRRSSVLTDGGDDHGGQETDPQIIFPGDHSQLHQRGVNSNMAPSPRIRRSNVPGLSGLSRTSPISPLAPRRNTFQHPANELPKLPEHGLLGRVAGAGPDRDAALARAIRAWNKSQFVKDGWFSAREAIAYVE